MPNKDAEKTESAHKKNNRKPFFIVLAVIALLSPYAYFAAHNSVCKYPYRKDTDIVVNKSNISTEVVTKDTDLQKGLSGRPCIGKSQGMLFVFNTAGQYGFWMKDTKFPIDIVWFNSSGRIVKIQSNVSPSTYPQTFTNKEPAQYVLELKAGRASQLGVTTGSVIPLKLQ